MSRLAGEIAQFFTISMINFVKTAHKLSYLFLDRKRATVVFQFLWFSAPRARSSFSEVKVAILLPICYCCFCFSCLKKKGQREPASKLVRL